MKNKTRVISLVITTLLCLSLLTTATSVTPTINPIIPGIIASLLHKPVESISGSLTSMGTKYDGQIYTAGDQGGNLQVKCFLAFDISSIPADATITSATLGLTDNRIVLGNPFATLGKLSVYNVNYGNTLELSDFDGPKLSTVWSGNSLPSESN